MVSGGRGLVLFERVDVVEVVFPLFAALAFALVDVVGGDVVYERHRFIRLLVFV